MRCDIGQVCILATLVAAIILLGTTCVKCDLETVAAATASRNQQPESDKKHVLSRRAICPQCNENSHVEDLRFCINCDYQGAPKAPQQETQSQAMQQQTFSKTTLPLFQRKMAAHSEVNPSSMPPKQARHPLWSQRKAQLLQEEKQRGKEQKRRPLTEERKRQIRDDPRRLERVRLYKERLKQDSNFRDHERDKKRKWQQIRRQNPLVQKKDREDQRLRNQRKMDAKQKKGVRVKIPARSSSKSPRQRR